MASPQKPIKPSSTKPTTTKPSSTSPPTVTKPIIPKPKSNNTTTQIKPPQPNPTPKPTAKPNSNIKIELKSNDNDANLNDNNNNLNNNLNDNPNVNINNNNNQNLPVNCIIIGMAGSGKTTLMQRINAHIHQHKLPSYIINLDPAVYEIPYEANIDIRDTINYKNIMKQYKLGPNGGILTSLNLFSTKFDSVINLIKKREKELKYVFIDTPGQIEVFTWSASGQIITETLSYIFPTVILYVIDTSQCVDPITFMSNMTYACSILYKTKLPFLIVFNKIDVKSHLFAINWINNLNDFQSDISNSGNKSYMTTLIKSLSNVLDSFYANILTVGVSAITGQGINELFKQIEICKQQYYNEYKPMLIKKKNYIKKQELIKKQNKIKKLQSNLNKKKINQKTMKSQQIKNIYKNNQKPSKNDMELLMNMGLSDDDDNDDDDD